MPSSWMAASSARDHLGVELRPGARLELGDRGFERERGSIRPIGDERVEGVARKHDPRRKRDRLVSASPSG